MSIEKIILAKTDLVLKGKHQVIEKHSVENIIIEIIDFVTKTVSNIHTFNWNEWHIGLTVYPHQEKREQGKPVKWKSWKANSHSDAIKIQKYFIDKYPINLNRRNGQYDYFVYIFKK